MRALSIRLSEYSLCHKLDGTAAARLQDHLKSHAILRDLRHTLEATAKTPQEIPMKRGFAGGQPIMSPQTVLA
jgi:hypothetical protein